VFWGDLGGASIDILDCLPATQGWNWTVRAADEEGVFPTPVRGDLGAGKLTNEQRAAIIAGKGTLASAQPSFGHGL